MQSKIDHFSTLFRELECEIGTRDLAFLILKSLIDTIRSFKSDNSINFCKQFKELADIVSSTEPKFGIINYNFAKLFKEFGDCKWGPECATKRWKNGAIKKVKAILKNAKDNKTLLIENSEKIDVEGKTILIHDHSHTVQDVIAHYKAIGKHFKVIIAEQDFDKTHANIERIYNAQIPFQVVPAYMLSHVHYQIDMAFFGSLTLKDTMHFVMDPGTHGIISECNVDHVPVYMFMDTSKFSLWKSTKRGEVFMHKQSKMHHFKPIEYERIKYSHDRVEAKLFHKIVTNKGIFTPVTIKKFFSEKMKEYGGK